MSPNQRKIKRLIVDLLAADLAQSIWTWRTTSLAQLEAETWAWALNINRQGFPVDSCHRVHLNEANLQTYYTQAVHDAYVKLHMLAH